MLFTRSVAISILATLGVQGLVIPSVDEVIDVFGKNNGKEVISSNKAVGHAEHNNVASNLDIKLLSSKEAAPVANAESVRDIIPNKYIIVFKDGLTPEEIQFHQEWVAAEHSGSVGKMQENDPFVQAMKELNIAGGILDSFNINNVLHGYTGFFNEATINMIRRNPLVKFVERDSIVHASEFDTQKGAPWGLARVSHREPLSLNSFNQYLYDNEGGKGVTAYIIDTGVNVEHDEFKGRAKWGSTIPEGDADVDGNGHGTHCAGTIGSNAYGVAKGADLVAVKVLRSNGSGSMSDVVKGVEFATKSHLEAVKENKKGFKGSTANMSLGGGKSPALDMVVNAAVKAGIHFAVAAGNENQDACNTSPASAENAITVGASTIADARAYFSNYGKCVDIFAPGLNILSTYIGSNSATATLSGTSMASPHICGLLSYYLSLQPSGDSQFALSGNGVSPSQLKKNLIHYGSKGVLSDIPDDGTPNILAFNGAGHNLTEFWHDDASESTTKDSSKDSDVSKKLLGLESKVEKLIQKAEHDSQGLFKDIKSLVEDAYSNTI